MGIPDHLICLLRNLYAGQEATVRTGHGTTDWFQIRKGVCQGCILSPCLFNLYAKYIIQNTGLDKAQAGIKIAGRNINNLRYTDDTTLMEENEEELNSRLMKVKEKSEKVGLKKHSENQDHGIWSYYFMGNRWGNDGNSETLFLEAPKSLQMVTAAMKLKDVSTSQKKSYEQPRQHIKKQRHYFTNKGLSSQSYGFSVVMYGCESWTLKKAEPRRIYAFEL